MKLTTIHMLLALVGIVAVSLFVLPEGFSPSILHPAPFSLESFQASSVPSASSASSIPSAPSAPSVTSTKSSSLIPSVSSVAPASLVSPVSPAVVPVSDMAYDAMTLKQRSNLLHEIQRTVRDELLASRALEKPDSENVGQGSSSRCPSDEQGQEYEMRCPKNPDGSCPPVPDLTEYIRKDQIPCWGCSIDY